MWLKIYVDSYLSCHVEGCSKNATNWFVAKLCSNYIIVERERGKKLYFDYIIPSYKTYSSKSTTTRGFKLTESTKNHI